MQALILAAGNSRRLLPQTADFPKTLLKLDGQEILGHILDWCIMCGIRKFNIVTGHGEKYIKEFAAKYCSRLADARSNSRNDDIFPVTSKAKSKVILRARPKTEPKSSINNLKFNFIYNPKYKEWGNIYSLYVAKETFKEDFILINSDVIFKKEILKRLIVSPRQNAMSIDDSKTLSQEEMKVYLNSQGCVQKIHKKLDPKKSDGEYIGILKISASIKDQLIRSLEDKLSESKSVYYEDAVQLLLDRGVPIYKVSTHGLPCMEIDTPEDLKKAKVLIKKCK